MTNFTKKEDLYGMIARTDCQMYDRGPIIDIFRDDDEIMITIDDPEEGHETNPITDMIIEWPYAKIWSFNNGECKETFICNDEFNKDIVNAMINVAYKDITISNLKCAETLTQDISMRNLLKKINKSNI